MTPSLQFEPLITAGNVLTIISFLVVALSAFLSLRERAKTNAYLIGELRERLDRCAVEEIKEKVAIMWLFQLRRGLVEAEIKGLIEKNE